MLKPETKVTYMALNCMLQQTYQGVKGLVAQLITGILHLALEAGRFKNIPEVENVLHFPLCCPYYDELIIPVLNESN